MKLFLTSISFLLVLNACFISKKQKKEPITTITEDKTIIRDTNISRLLVSKDEKDSSKLELAYQYFIHPKFGWQDSINQLVANFIYQNTLFELPEKTKISCSDQSFSACLDTFTKLAQSVEADEEYLMGLWELELRTSISDEHKNFASFYAGTYSYTGGAHGNSYYNHVHVDKNNGINLSLGDFFNDLSAFNQLADSCFRAQNGISANANLSDLDFWFEDGNFSCNNNFYFGEDAIYFIFNTYEVAPYSHGLIEFHIPVELYKKYLKFDLSKK